MGVSMSHNTKIYGRAYLPYYLVIYLVRSLEQMEISLWLVVILLWYPGFLNKVWHSYLHGLSMFISCSLFMLHVLDYMYHQMWFTVLSIIPQKLKKCIFPICVCWIGGSWDVFVGDFSPRVLHYRKYCKKHV